MTAVVAILNKTGMALAADSAATITNGNTETSKVFNTANKGDLCTKQPLCSRHTTKPKKNKEWQ